MTFGHNLGFGVAMKRGGGVGREEGYQCEVLSDDSILHLEIHNSVLKTNKSEILRVEDKIFCWV